MILFINGCVRVNSRTLDLANTVLDIISENRTKNITEICLYKNDIEYLDADRLSLREKLVSEKNYDHPIFDLAHQFAKADTIVVAAPFWDLLFPAKVRTYFENVTVSGITFKYSPKGIPQGLCKANRLVYVTTAGGPIVQNFGFEYVKALSQTFYGISNVDFVKAEGLDIIGADPTAIIENTKKNLFL
ncbi:MAG: NAD(P)H-dependent oxidoreductase [Clostridia bacterium]|nr:NAD(P)H-dependent oxidoreductase [Clostridia bacterium]